MKKWAALIIATALLPTVAAATTMQSGSTIVDSNTYVPNYQHAQPSPITGNLLMNGGFETGGLPPWTTDNWTITNTDKHSGTYSAWDVGNHWIMQSFSPTAVGTIMSISAWEKQDSGTGFAAVDFLYDDNTNDEFLVAPGVDWTYLDLTGHLRSSGNLTGVRFWGYSGAGDQLTQLDDVDLEVQGANPVHTTTWGQVKNLYK